MAETVPTAARYAIDGGPAGMSRLDVLARVMWPTTEAWLATTGVPAGARCLDLGCGGGHVSVELARMVGPTGSVIGVDLDAEIIELARSAARAQSIGNATFRVGTADEIGGGPYDLGYARFLLSHVANPQRVVDALAAASAPGGAVIVEDIDFTGSFCHPDNDAFNRSVQLYREIVRRRGGNADIGPALPGLLTAAGLPDVRVRVVQPASIHGEAKAMCLLTLERTAAAVVAEGVAAPAEVESVLVGLRALVADGTSLVGTPRIVQAAGRRPRA